MSNSHPASRWSKRNYWQKDWLEREYVTNRKSAVAIARECDCTTNCIYFWLVKHDIPRRGIAAAAQLREARKRGTP